MVTQEQFDHLQDRASRLEADRTSLVLAILGIVQALQSPMGTQSCAEVVSYLRDVAPDLFERADSVLSPR